MSSKNNNHEQPKKSKNEIIFKVLRQISYTKLFKKYTSGNFSFLKITTNHLINNDRTLIVARFKEFLIYDDSSEFIHRFYPKKESFPRLIKILNFYETYSKIFPNYLVLKENKYLYRNIRKKQKMINAINEIKREEKENQKKLGIKEKTEDIFNKNKLFTKTIKDEIKKFQKNLSGKIYKNSFDTDNQDEDDTLIINQNSISISVLNWKEFEKNNLEKLNENDYNINEDSFSTNKNNDSITKMLSILNDNKIYIEDLPKILMENKNINIYSNKNPNNTKQNKINGNSKDKKIKYNKNELIKYSKTKSNAVTSSSTISKRIKKTGLFSSNNNTKENNIKINNRNHVNEILSLSKKIDSNTIKNKKTNLQNQLSPKMKSFQHTKQFYYNTNIIKNSKTPTHIDKTKKSDKKPQKKEKIVKNDIATYSNNNENIKSQLNNNISKKYLTENNQNIKLGESIGKEQKSYKEKLFVNLRDIIKRNKRKKIFYTAKKEKNKKDFLLNFTENITNSNISKKTMKFFPTKNQKNLNSLANLNCNKNKFDFNKNKNDNSTKTQKVEVKGRIMNKQSKNQNDEIKRDSIFTKGKTELNIIKESKSLVSINSKINNLKRKTKLINKPKDNLLINSNEEINSLENKRIENYHTQGNKPTNIKHLIPLKNQKINKKVHNLGFNTRIINNNNKRVKTISNEERIFRTTLNTRSMSKSNNISRKNLYFLKRIQSTKDYMKKNPTDFNRYKLNKTNETKNKRFEFDKNNNTITSQRLNNLKAIKEKTKKINIFSHTIKVNKTYINRKMNKILLKEKSEKFINKNNNSETKRSIK